MSLRSLPVVTLLLLIPVFATADDVSLLDDNEVDCDYCYPAWTITAEGLIMRRRPSASQPLTDLIPQWNVSGMDFNYEVGPRISIIRHFDGPYSFELNYFGIYDQGATKTRSSNLVQIVGPGFQYANAAAQPYHFNYESDLSSLELNLRRNWSDRTTVTAGFRWVELSEDFDHLGNATPVYSLDTNNQLYGFQLGAERLLLRPHAHGFRLEGFAKAGIYYNSADGGATSTGAFGTPTGTAAASDSGAAFVGETGLIGVLPIRDGLYLRGGFQVLWIDGIATAPNQLPNFSTLTSAATLNRTYSAFYYGGFLGVVGEF